MGNVREMNEADIKDVSDSELLAAAEEIIKKSLASGLAGNDDEKLGNTQGKMPEEGQGSTGSAPQEANSKNKKKDGADIMGTDVKKSQADIEGKETGGLAPSVQGDHAAEQKGNGAKGGSEQEANPNSKTRGDASLSGAGASDHGTEKFKEGELSGDGKNKNKAKGPTQDGDSQEEANEGSHTQQAGEKKVGSEGGAGSSHETQTGDSQDEANDSSLKPGEDSNLSKSKEVKELTKMVKALNDQVKSLQKSLKEKEPLKKSAIHADVLEKLSKSYISQIEAVKKENEDLKKSYDNKFAELKQQNEDLAKAMKKPAHTRQSLTNVEAIEKGSTDGNRKIFKSKGEVLAKMEELRKSGKVTGDDIISYNSSGFMSDDVKKALFNN